MPAVQSLTRALDLLDHLATRGAGRRGPSARRGQELAGLPEEELR